MFATALRMASTFPLQTAVLIVAVTSGVLSIRQMWILLGPPHQRDGPPKDHYTSWLEKRSDALEQTLDLYAAWQADGLVDALGTRRKALGAWTDWLRRPRRD